MRRAHRIARNSALVLQSAMNATLFLHLAMTVARRLPRCMQQDALSSSEHPHHRMHTLLTGSGITSLLHGSESQADHRLPRC